MTKKLNGVTFGQMVRRYFPDAINDDIEFILWEKTGYPVFWNGDPIRCLAQQLRRLREKIKQQQGAVV